MAHKHKQRMLNGYAKDPVDGATRVDASPAKPVGILQHIADISQVSGPKHKAIFGPIQGPSRAEQEEIKLRNLPPRRNIRNLKLVEGDSEDEEERKAGLREKEAFNENSVRADLRSLYGGRQWHNNRYLEERWTKPRENSSSKSKNNNSEQDAAQTKDRRDVFARNIGMRGWMSMQEPENIGFQRVNGNRSKENVGENSCNVPFVQDSEDPDFISRQLCGVGNDDDFIVEHVGKITSVTAREFSLHNVKDSDFVFSRNKK